MAHNRDLDIFFEKKRQKVWRVTEKSVPLHSQFRNEVVNKLGYGVMVTLQILVLSFLVRVRVPQHPESQASFLLGFFVLISFLFCPYA